MRLKFPMLENDPELRAQLERVEFSPDIAEQIGDDLPQLMQTASPSQTVQVGFEIAVVDHQPVVVRYVMELVQRPN
jgi:hypothetical protein